MIEYIKSDIYRYYGRVSFSLFLKSFFLNKTLRFQIIFRMRSRGNRGFRLLGYFLSKIFKNNNMQIPIQTQIGYGLYIGHNGPVIINATAVLGNNVNLSQFCTIGANEGKAPIIGNNVYVGPNTVIIENIKIGNNVTIGAGSVVTKSIPDNATAAGNYAKILNYNNPSRFILNKWN